MSILITGGAGFIGSNLVEDLLNSGQEVVVLDNMHTGSLNNLAGLDENLNVIEASCLEIPILDLNPMEIFHLGIPSSSPMYKKQPFLVGEAINGTIAVFELAKKSSARVVYASSSSLYNGLNPPHREDMKILVTDYYTEARLAVERIAELYYILFGLKSIGLRFFSAYGIREESKKMYANMVTQFLWKMKEGKPPVIYGDGTQTRDFIYINDIVRALKMAMNSDYHGILNAGTGKSYSFNEVIELLNNHLQLEIKPTYVENPIKNYVYHTLSDTSKAESVLGFRSQWSLEEGIERLAEGYGYSIP